MGEEKKREKKIIYNEWWLIIKKISFLFLICEKNLIIFFIISFLFGFECI
jgi:hypothetical protein